MRRFLRVVVREIWALLVLLGEAFFVGFKLPIEKSKYIVFRPHIGQYAGYFDTRHVDMIALPKKGKASMTPVLFGEP